MGNYEGLPIDRYRCALDREAFATQPPGIKTSQKNKARCQSEKYPPSTLRTRADTASTHSVLSEAGKRRRSSPARQRQHLVRVLRDADTDGKILEALAIRCEKRHKKREVFCTLKDSNGLVKGLWVLEKRVPRQLLSSLLGQIRDDQVVNWDPKVTFIGQNLLHDKASLQLLSLKSVRRLSKLAISYHSNLDLPDSYPRTTWATARIRRGEVIGVYAGRVFFPHRDGQCSVTPYTLQFRHGDCIISANRYGNELRFVNSAPADHRALQNCKFDYCVSSDGARLPVMRATRDILPGEEILNFYDVDDEALLGLQKPTRRITRSSSRDIASFVAAPRRRRRRRVPACDDSADADSVSTQRLERLFAPSPMNVSAEADAHSTMSDITVEY